MAAILQLVLRYILLGISTAFAFVGNYFFNTDHVATSTPLSPAQEFKVPTKELDFIFDTPAPMPETIIVPKTEVKPSIPKQEIPKVAPTPVQKPVIIPKPTLTQTATSTEVVLNTNDAVVNIICTETIGNLTRTTTGSGVIISPRGVIVTNAHVAIDFMDPANTCTIRTGSPAKNAYRAHLVYIPTAWIENNKEYVSSGIARTTTGEHDFALLVITHSATSAKLPLSFVYMKPRYINVKVGDDIVTSGYPAARVGLFSALSSMHRVTDESEVKKIYSFGETSSDVFSTGKVANAEHGSSGGAIIKGDEVVGIIANVNSGTINALSMAYIREYFEKDTKESFGHMLLQ